MLCPLRTGTKRVHEAVAKKTGPNPGKWTKVLAEDRFGVGARTRVTYVRTVSRLRVRTSCHSMTRQYKKSRALLELVRGLWPSSRDRVLEIAIKTGENGTIRAETSPSLVRKTVNPSTFVRIVEGFTFT